MSVEVKYCFVRSTRKRGINSFYGGPHPRKRLPMAWRVTVDNQSALRTAFKRKIDADMAAAGLRRAGLDSIPAITAAGWQKVEQTMFESLQW